MPDWLPGYRQGTGGFRDRQAGKPGPRQAKSLHYDWFANIVYPQHIPIMARKES
jgi:hypothetical protein